MSALPLHRDELHSLISDMEPNVRDLPRWGLVLIHLSASPHMVEEETLHLVGAQVRELGRKIEADWDRLLDLSRGRFKP